MNPGDRVRYTGPRPQLQGLVGKVVRLCAGMVWVDFEGDTVVRMCGPSELQRVPAVQPNKDVNYG